MEKSSDFCPLDVKGIGGCIWEIIKKIGENYPEKASKAQQREMYIFIHLFAQLYPCQDCSTHLLEAIKNMPPPLDSKKNFTKWLCALNNILYTDPPNEVDPAKNEPIVGGGKDNECECGKENRRRKGPGSRNQKKNKRGSRSTDNDQQVAGSSKRTN